MRAVAPKALNDQQLHFMGLSAYWHAVDDELAREAAATEAAERAALTETRAALADAIAEHAALLAQIAALEAAQGGAKALAAQPVGPASVHDGANIATGTTGSDGDASGAKTRDIAVATAPVTAKAAEAVAVDAISAAALPQTKALEKLMIDAAPDAACAGPAATPKAVAQRRRAAVAALDERLAPVRAEHEEARAALPAAVDANAVLHARLAAMVGAGADAAAPA